MISLGNRRRFAHDIVSFETENFKKSRFKYTTHDIRIHKYVETLDYSLYADPDRTIVINPRRSRMERLRYVFCVKTHNNLDYNFKTIAVALLNTHKHINLKNVEKVHSVYTVMFDSSTRDCGASRG